ncbi:PQQ-dependent sugar dehydrogenase [Reyranella soli]|uniref:Sorbosone dehydrogenase n=1 Tax=Reyranella soli TaxID=1230389 RepID=A0A512ND87_9HYPH|nr:PQQ-dependent sugar dehydrogenase [Reyranella soli]GEP56909.1 sorbosone dehydrogenase [Reyranella soli]
MRRQETALAKACLAGVIAAVFGCASMAVQAQELKKYDSSGKDFWLKPPPDWFLGDENKEQKGQTPNPGQPTPTPKAELDKILAGIKLPPGFKIAVWADSVPQARQMAWGDKGTLFVGTFDKGTVHSVSGPDGQKVVKPFITGLRMPTGVAFQDGALYVVDIDKLYRYDNPEANLERAPEGKVVYDDFPPYVPHGWKYLVPDGKGWFYIPVGVPCNICLPPASTGHYRRVDPKTGAAEIVALGVRNSVGGAVDPRTGQLWFTDNGRDWVSDDLPNDELNRVSKIGEHFGYPYCHQGDLADPKYGADRKCSEFTPPVYKQGPHIAGLGMKFYTGDMFPPEYKNGIFIAQHGSWNRAKKLGYRVLFLSVDPDGKNPKEQVFAGTWLDDQKILGRPADVLQAPDGSLLVADDQAGAIYRISYQK